MENHKSLTVTANQYPIEQIERMAVAFAKSGLFGIKTPEQGIALMLIAQAEGLHPAVAARDYHIIQGRPALKSDSLLARFHAAGGKATWGEYSDKAVSGTFSHPQGGTVTVTWTIEQAKAAGLTGKDVWKQYPRAMLRARVISEAIRTVYPGVSVGVYTVEEVQDFDAKPETREVVAEPVESETRAKSDKLPKADPERAELFAKLKNSKWTKEQLSGFSEFAWNIGSAAKLETAQLKLLVSISETVSYDEAMLAEEASRQTSFDGAEWEQA